MENNVAVSEQTQSQQGFLSNFIKNRKFFLLAALLATIIILLPTPEGLSVEGQRALALMVFVVVCFFTEAIPLPAVALIIGSYQVLLGLTDFREVPKTFMADAVAFIMGALMIGSILVKYKIHNRIALFILNISGTNVNKVAFGIITFCAFSAGFISEHATATIMLPIGVGIVSLCGGIKKVPNLGKLLMLAIAYGCIIGGLASPSGGARNALMIGFLSQYDVSISYGQWVIMAMPFTLIMIPLTVFWLTRCFKPEISDLKEPVESIKKEMAAEGKMNTEAKMALGIFLAVLTLWITMSHDIGLGNIAVMGAVVAMILGLVDWNYLQKNTQWGVVLLYAGAISMGSLLQATGAALWLAENLLTVVSSLGITEGLPLVGAITVITAITTNAMADGPTVAVLGPIFLQVAELANTSPYAIGVATSLGSAFAYLLIIGTPANAIVYGPGFLKASDYLKAGSVMFLMSVALVVFGLVGFYWQFLGVW
ncbi:MAG: DASS family sodium-coupled anion symporter [Firmicutes bacterium]|nr:DASS family sodium-coupled anion symporter [Bacillota bacterium]